MLQQLSKMPVFPFFEQISAIPRASSAEEGIAAFLCDFARSRGLWFRTDAMHNVLIKKDATAGYENEPTVMLQGHMDMVCVKTTDSTHDFSKDPIRLICTGDWLHADNTSLGADNGIAVTMMLAVLDDASLQHGALECLFTVQEETGLSGAAAFDYSDCCAELLFNLDSEDEGIATVSCAGGVRCDIQQPLTRTACDGMTGFSLIADGFAGGHSGMDIALGRVNAIRTLGCLLTHLRRQFAVRLVQMDGGEMDNAIPCSCRVQITVPQADQGAFITAAQQMILQRYSSFSKADAAAAITLSPSSVSMQPLTQQDTDTALTMITSVPCGVLRRMQEDTAQIETSANLGIVRTATDKMVFTVSVRSCVEERRADVQAVLCQLARTLGMEISFRGEYPGWAYDAHSKSRNRYCNAYFSLFGQKPRVESIHAGLECGVIKSHMPRIDPISFGPDLKDVHTPFEQLCISSVCRTYRLLQEMLSKKDITI